MMVLARSCSHMRSTSARARAGSLSATSTSIYLPWRTLPTEPKPSAWSAPAIALPCGSSTPGFSVMVMRAFMLPSFASVLFRAHQHRARARPRRVVDMKPESARHLLIGLDQAAHVAAEAVLVELVLRLDVPQPATIGRDLVSKHDAHLFVVPEPAELAFEVDESYADAEKEAREEVVDAERERHDVVDLLGRRPAEGGNMLLGDHRVAELVVLVIELDDRARERRSLVDAHPSRERSGGDVAHHHLERDDLDLADQLLTHIEPLDEMRRHADLAELLEQILGDAVVEDTFALDLVVLLVVEGGGVVLEMLDERPGLRALIEDLGFAFVDAPAAVHGWFLTHDWLQLLTNAKRAGERLTQAARNLQIAIAGIDSRGLGPTLA